MEDVLNSVKTLTIAELREQLIDRGHKVGPVTATTKTLFQKKLAKLIYKEKFGDVSGSEVQIESKSLKIKELQPEKTNEVVHDGVSSVYYGISLADGETGNLLDQSDKKLVFTNKVEAFSVAKEHPGSRFKAFKTFDEALKFVKSNVQNCNRSFITQTNNNSDVENGGSGVVVEKSMYKAPKMRELVNLRNIIEKGDENEFMSLVWSNPRYLVSSGDTPVILHEGQRYNALHTAAKANQPDMCRRLLETILDLEFSKQLYVGSSDSEETQDRRVQFLADLYLNMPDRGNGESPLHFASKFGYPEVVAVLLGYPCTDRNMKNRYGETPQDIVCSRCDSPSKDVKIRIAELLQGLCYVPLLRSKDNTSSPVIGQPWSPDQSVSPLSQLGKSPIDPQLAVRARAGPMSPSKAQLFYRQWTTPLSGSPLGNRKTVASIKREDGDKGVERIGRQLAHEMHIPWLEYWEFLDAFVDLGTESGVAELEKHFMKQQSALMFTECLQNINLQDITNHSVFHSQADLGSSFTKLHDRSLIQASSLSASGGVHLLQPVVESPTDCDNSSINKNHSNSECGTEDCDKKHATSDSNIKLNFDDAQAVASQRDNSRSFGNLTSTPKTNTWSYRQHHASGDQESPDTKSAGLHSPVVSPAREHSQEGSLHTVAHIRAPLLNTPDTRVTSSQPGVDTEYTETPSEHADRHINESVLNHKTGDSEFSREIKEETQTPETWAYRLKSGDTDQASPVKEKDIFSPGESVESPASNGVDNSFLASLSKMKLSSGENQVSSLTNSHVNESDVFSTPRTVEVSFNTALGNLCSDFENKLMFTPKNTKLCSISPTTVPYGQITLSLGKSHHAVEAFQRLSNLKVVDEKEDLLSHNAPVIVLIKSGVKPSCDTEKPGIVVDIWVSKDDDLKMSVNNVFPDVIVPLQSADIQDRFLCLESPELVNVDMTCEEKYTLRQHTVPVQALFLNTDHQTHFTVHILGLRHSKADLDVFRAVKNTPIEANRFPLTRHWMEQMALLAADSKQSWPSPSRLRSEARISRNSSCLSPLVTGSSSFRSKRMVSSPVDWNARTILFPASPKQTGCDTRPSGCDSETH